MATTFKYRLVKASWAIAIDITADAIPTQANPPGATCVSGRLWLKIEPGWLSHEERKHLEAGLRLVSKPILESRPPDEQVLIRILDVSFNPIHYQVEGLAAAIIGWAAQEFSFTKVEIPIAVQQDRKRYVYRFGDAGTGAEYELTITPALYDFPGLSISYTAGATPLAAVT